MSRPVRLLAACAAALALLGATGCGEKLAVRTVGETEGLYVDIGGLKYQVQISRILNPADAEDRSYLVGLPPGSEPGEEETWFAVFLRVANSGEEGREPTATEFEIVDTQEEVYRPLPVSDENPFAYRPDELGPGELIPNPDSLAGQGPIQGSMLLFKLTYESLANRPLEFKIFSPENPDEVGIVDLDV